MSHRQPPRRDRTLLNLMYSIHCRALMGCITAVPADIFTSGHVQHMVEVNYLCVHKKLR